MSGWPIASRIIIGGAAYASVVLLAPEPDAFLAVVGVLLLAGTALGLIAASWWAVPAGPVALVITGLAVRATDCPDCGGGGEPLPAGAVAILFVLAMALAAALVVPGVLVTKAIARATRPGLARDPQQRSALAIAVPVLTLGIAAVAFAVERDRNADANGAVVFETNDTRYREGPPLDSDGGQGMSTAELRAFDVHPVFWLGESFAGFNLGYALSQGNGPPTAQWSVGPSVTLIYGDCGPAPCSGPLQVDTSWVCKSPQEILADTAAFEPLPSGALLQLPPVGGPQGDMTEFGVWSGGVYIKVYHLRAIERQQILDALAGLRGEPLGPPALPTC